MTDAILEITDGTTTISLINPSSGFHMISWTPGITDYKGGGVFTNPPLADWRQLRVGKWDTVQEQFGVTINGQNPNGVAYMLQELRRLLEKANAYWTTGWQNDPVYLVAKAKCETETRYCLIVKGRLANDQNYYQQPFTGKCSTMQDLPLIIERRAWLETAPGTRTAVPISNEVEYDGRTLGRAGTTANEVFHANKRTVANITNVHVTTAGANLMDAALPYTILDVSGTNSTYFGIDASVSDSGPFDSLIFDIGTAQVGATVVWEYWNGSTWASFTSFSNLNDHTSSFTNTGVNAVVINQQTNWVAASPGGALPVGYYVRARVTATGSVNATQQNRLIYSQTVPYVEIAAGQVPGDIPALAQLTLENAGVMGVSGRTISRAILGLRSSNRGIAAFTPYINLSDEQNPTGISISSSGGFASGSEFPTGRAATDTTATVTSDVYTTIITIDSSIASEFFGTYHVYLRHVLPSGYDVLNISLKGSIGLTSFCTTESVSALSNTMTDLGLFSILPEFSLTDPGDTTLTITANVTTSVGGLSFEMIDLILIPIDEWSVELREGFNDLGENIFDADSLTNKKKMLEVSIRSPSTNERLGLGSSVNNGPAILQANSQQRLYSFAWRISGSSEIFSYSNSVKSGQIWRNSRYLSLRGER